jgi:hypothetical protein
MDEIKVQTVSNFKQFNMRCCVQLSTIPVDFIFVEVANLQM